MPRLEEVPVSKSVVKRQPSKSISSKDRSSRIAKKHSKKTTLKQDNKTLMKGFENPEENLDYDSEDRTLKNNNENDRLDRTELSKVKSSFGSGDSYNELNANELTVQNFKPLKTSLNNEQDSSDVKNGDNNKMNNNNKNPSVKQLTTTEIIMNKPNNPEKNSTNSTNNNLNNLNNHDKHNIKTTNNQNTNAINNHNNNINNQNNPSTNYILNNLNSLGNNINNTNSKSGNESGDNSNFQAKDSNTNIIRELLIEREREMNRKTDVPPSSNPTVNPSDTKPAQPTEDEQKMLDSIKLFFQKIQPNVNIKKDDREKAKLLEELSEKLHCLEKEKILFTKHYEAKEKNYLSKIKSLEQQIVNAEKVDMESLQKKNKEYEIQIANLKKLIEKLNLKINEEKAKFNEFAAEVIQLKDKLASELKEVEKLKKELSNDEKEQNSKNKTEIQLKDSTNYLNQENRENDRNNNNVNTENIINRNFKPENSLKIVGTTNKLLGMMKSARLNNERNESPQKTSENLLKISQELLKSPDTLKNFQESMSIIESPMGDMSLNKKIRQGMQGSHNQQISVMDNNRGSNYNNINSSSKSSSYASSNTNK